ncbi:MAG: hypothetical protein C0625_15450 [Arcobacter sp.]|nr:MAG: hypothetical protein C0625_15450 [Arcobacter sp.]
MSKICKCGYAQFITIDSILLLMQPSSEPYKNGVEEDLIKEDADYLDESYPEVNICICRNCKNHFYWIDGEEYIKKKNHF